MACLAFGAAYAQDVTTVFYDIRPKVCPNFFTPPSGSLLTIPLDTAVLGTDEFDVQTALPSSLVLIVPGGGGVLGGGTPVYPVETFFKDVARPVADPTDCQCTDEGPDDIEDLVAQFDPKEVAKALGPVEDGQEIPLCLEGLLEGGGKITGCDCIVIKTSPLAVEAGSWGRTKATYRE
jgi:hypothetical protein